VFVFADSATLAPGAGTERSGCQLFTGVDGHGDIVRRDLVNAETNKALDIWG
jgi:hypothetical protein